MKHLLSTNDLTLEEINLLLASSESYIQSSRGPWSSHNKVLKGYDILLLFFESSTRTRTAFELAAHRLGAETITLNIENSALKKSESIVDTVATLDAMNIDAIVIRHPESGMAKHVSEHVSCHVINAGDGENEHPTQALTDALVLRRHFGKIEGLKVAICGDVMHSRVARSNIQLLIKLGVQVNIIAPNELVPDYIWDLTPGIQVYNEMRMGLEGCDAIMMLRLQQERMRETLIPSISKYSKHYGLDQHKLEWAKPKAIVMHPGPMNRGIEIDNRVADGPQSVILEQVKVGVAVRQGCLVTVFAEEILSSEVK